MKNTNHSIIFQKDSLYLHFFGLFVMLDLVEAPVLLTVQLYIVIMESEQGLSMRDSEQGNAELLAVMVQVSLNIHTDSTSALIYS